ncbi:hypothetical protein, partial [Tritonibacter sp. SIMBA_163]|uniref:hypothetical protein n=1 Tax=Tritonibacter sp. SIMBA_163 TaxID=3080868 RepID=UPI00397FABD0
EKFPLLEEIDIALNELIFIRIRSAIVLSSNCFSDSGSLIKADRNLTVCPEERIMQRVTRLPELGSEYC